MVIATLGDINIDTVIDVDDMPRRGGEVFSTRRQEMLGGSAVNTAAVLTRLGLRSTVMGAVGDDDAGRRALTQLRSVGVGTDLTSRSQTHPTAMNTILVTPDRERTMIATRGANVVYTAPPDWHEIIDWLHVSGYAFMEGDQQESAMAVLESANRRGIPTSLDVPLGLGERIRHLIADELANLHIVSGSRSALSEITDSTDPVKQLIGSGTLQVAMTSGVDPMVVAGTVGEITLTPPVVDAIDVTGAGDAFVAGLIAATVAGLDPGPSAVLAAATGAAATLVSGAAETLADPEVWAYLLSPERWSDADPRWLDEVRAFVESRGLFGS